MVGLRTCSGRHVMEPFVSFEWDSACVYVDGEGEGEGGLK